MKTDEVIRHLKCLVSGKCVCPTSHHEAVSQAIEILQRTESERRPWASTNKSCISEEDDCA